MHGLDIIIKRNAEAAGREAAHHDNDGDERTASKIINARPPIDLCSISERSSNDAFWGGYWRARNEG